MSEPETLPPRPRRRLITPWTLGLGAVIVAALGFIGGVQVQKGKASTSGAAPAAFSRAGGGFGQADGGSAPVVGTVSDKSGRTLYVKTTSDDHKGQVDVECEDHAQRRAAWAPCIPVTR